MDEASLINLYALQNTVKATSTATKSSVSGGSFADILADKMNESLLEGSVNSVSSSSSQSKASGISDLLNYSMMNTLSDTSGDSSNIEMLLLMIMMMYANSSDNNSGMNALMASMTSASGNGISSARLSALSAGAASLANATSNYQEATDSSIVQAALTRLGDPYSKAKRGTDDYVDCSYLAKWAYEQVGITLPSTSVAQAKYCYDNGYQISKSELQPGDLVFWSNTSCNCGRWNEIHHVAIYAGDNKVIEAKPSTGQVVLDNIWGENGSDWKIFMYARPQK